MHHKKPKHQPLRPVGDEALDELVSEELRNNWLEERERFAEGMNATNWFGKFMPNNPFNTEVKSEFDWPLIEVRDFVT